MMKRNFTAIDLFCGAGGLSEGLRQAGFEVRAGSDFDQAAGATFRRTHRDAEFLGGPIQNLSARDFLRASDLSVGELDVLTGGPPCQAYSVYNHKRGMDDARSTLFRDYLRIVEGLSPRWVIMENVTGITSAGNGAALRAIMDGFAGLGYRIESCVLRAEEYGVPQERRRFVFMGNRTGEPIIWPEPTHGPGLTPLVTVYDAISDLPILNNGEASVSRDYGCEPKTEYQFELRQGSNGVFNHAAPRLASVNMQRMAYIPQGGSWRDVPVDLLPRGMQAARRCDHTKRYGRLQWDRQSSTILTKCDIHWGAYIHPEQNRSLTVREAARFQSFPDWFVFEGSQTDQFVQVGNAVPPILGRQLGLSLRSSIERLSEAA